MDKKNKNRDWKPLRVQLESVADWALDIALKIAGDDEDDRDAIENVRSFVQMLVQTERFGTPISKSLGVFADNMRVRRRQQAEEMAAKTTIKLIPPLVLFIFPSLFIVLLAPAILTIAHNMAAAFANQ